MNNPFLDHAAMPRFAPDLSKFATRAYVLVSGAFSMIIGLAWSSAVTESMQRFNLKRFGPWVYAMGITILGMLLTAYAPMAKQ